MNEQTTQPVFNPDGTGGQEPPAEHTMADMPDSGNPDSLPLVRLPAAALVRDPEDIESGREQGVAEELRAAYEGWLERRGVELARVPRLMMGEREYDLFRNAPSDYFDYARKTYGIPQDDQDNCQYALVDKRPDDPDLPLEPKLMIVNDVDFGTTIDPGLIAKDFQNGDPDSSDPSMPELPGDAYITVDIADTLTESYKALSTFTKGLMKGQTVDPFTSTHEDIGVRAGGLAPGQKDAYVWTGTPITKSVELTIAFPGQYDSVCVVSGQRREAANGKAGMAQIDDPTVILKIEGKALENLQSAYRRLYHEPDFALTEQQRSARDELFNDHVVSLISQTARENRAREDYERYERQTRQPQLRAREIPRG